MKKYILGLSALVLVFSASFSIYQNAFAITVNTSTSNIKKPLLINNTNFTKNLSIGSSGPDVKALQTLLIKNGFLPGNIDGKYGPNTAKAVINLQGKLNLPKTGKLDVKTRSLLNSFSSTLTSSGITLSDGCTSISGYSPMTGLLCDGSVNSNQASLCPNGMTIASNCTIPSSILPDLCPNGMTIASNCTKSTKISPTTSVSVVPLTPKSSPASTIIQATTITIPASVSAPVPAPILIPAPTPTTIACTSTLAASLANTPAPQNVAVGTVHFKFTTITLTNSCNEAVRVMSLPVIVGTGGSISPSFLLQNIMLYANGTHFGLTMSGGGMLLQLGDSLIIPRNSFVNIDIYADIIGGVGNYVFLGLSKGSSNAQGMDNLSSIYSTAEAIGNEIMIGNEVTIGNGTIGSSNVACSLSIVANKVPNIPLVNGDNLIYSFKLINNYQTKNCRLDTIRFIENISPINGFSLSSLILYENDVAVTNAVSIDGINQVNYVGLNKIIPTGVMRTYTLKGIISGIFGAPETESLYSTVNLINATDTQGGTLIEVPISSGLSQTLKN